MSVKELTKLTVTDLWKEFKGVRDFWDRQEEAVGDFRKRFIEGALEAERDILIGCRRHERSSGRIVYAVLSHLNEQWGKKPLKEFTQKD